MTDTPRPYRPANGTEGAWFADQWCDRCIADTRERRLRRPSALAGEQPAEWIVDGYYGPCCTAFEEADHD